MKLKLDIILDIWELGVLILLFIIWLNIPYKAVDYKKAFKVIYIIAKFNYFWILALFFCIAFCYNIQFWPSVSKLIGSLWYNLEKR